ncbi:MAG: hypothetical protein V4773_05690, partial [Verrucomicrobiota bacterium]
LTSANPAEAQTQLCSPDAFGLYPQMTQLGFYLCLSVQSVAKMTPVDSWKSLNPRRDWHQTVAASLRLLRLFAAKVFTASL